MEARAPRVGHKKSRGGCAQCKRRHVKCNEEKPCSNCVRHGVACSLAGGPYVPRDDAKTKRSPQTSPAASGSGLSPQPSYETPRSTSLTSASENAIASASGSALSSSVVLPIQTLTPSHVVRSPFAALSGPLGRSVRLQEHDWMIDLQLLYHYMTNTQQIVTETPEMTRIWLEETPKIAFASGYVMHALLGVSALHKAHLQPTLAPVYQSSAMQHLDKALILYRQDTGPATAGNADARFVFTWLVALFAYAIPPTIPPIEAIGELLMLVKGIDTILSETWFWVVQGPFSPVLTRGFQIPVSVLAARLPEATDYGLQHLDLMLGSEFLTTDEQRVYNSILTELKQLYDGITRGQNQTSLTNIICFPRQEPARFAELIQQRQSQALVLLAYYAVLLGLCDARWWMKGWAKRVMQCVSNAVEPQWQHWIAWPVRSVLAKDAQQAPGASRDIPMV